MASVTRLIHPSHASQASIKCGRCGGTGYLKTPPSASIPIWRCLSCRDKRPPIQQAKS